MSQDAFEVIEKLCDLLGDREEELSAARREISQLQEQLAEQVLKQEDTAGVRRTSPDSDRQISSSDLKVLIIDDSKIARIVLIKQLRNLGFNEMTEADSGEEGLKLLKLKPFDLILLDFEMKGGDGKWVLENCRKMKKNIPVVMISGTLEKEIILDCIQAGAADFLVKPVSPNVLLPRLEKVLGAKLV